MQQRSIESPQGKEGFRRALLPITLWPLWRIGRDLRTPVNQNFITRRGPKGGEKEKWNRGRKREDLARAFVRGWPEAAVPQRCSKTHSSGGGELAKLIDKCTTLRKIQPSAKKTLFFLEKEGGGQIGYLIQGGVSAYSSLPENGSRTNEAPR